MDVYVDVETKGLNCQAFVAGCVRRSTGGVRYFYTKKQMWEYLLDLSLLCLKNKRCLNVYAHNHIYDFLSYANLDDSNIKIYNESRPFIVSRMVGDKEVIKFLDTLAIFPFSLKKLGEIVGVQKKDIDNVFFDENSEFTIEKLQDMIRYNINGMKDYLAIDTLIPQKAIELLKKKLKDEGVVLKRLYTISQIAIAYIINQLKKDDKLGTEFWYNKVKGQVLRTRYVQEIHGAYRGGRVDAYQLGVFSKDINNDIKKLIQKGIPYHKSNVNYIDVNSLYPYSICNIDVPILNTERKIKFPLKKLELKYLLNKIGVSRALLYNRKCSDPYIPVRTEVGSYYPVIGSYIVGTYTHMELQYAASIGYDVIDIAWSVIWDKSNHNPFSTIYNRLYELRKSGSEFDNSFYKSIMNNSIGKMAQVKPNKEYVIDSIEEAEKYLDANYEIRHAKGSKYIYEIVNTKYTYKSYYMPIIPVLVNAYARIHMHKELSKIPMKDKVYTDTDSLIFYNKDGLNMMNFDIGEELGQFKVVNTDETAIIYGRKTYAIQNEIKISGIRKKDLTIQDFKDGLVESKKMVTIKAASDLSKVGTFITEKRDLHKQYQNAETVKNMMKEQRFYKDTDIKSIVEFVEILNKFAE